MNSNFNIFTAAVLIRTDSPGARQKPCIDPAQQEMSVSPSNSNFFFSKPLDFEIAECFEWHSPRQPSMECGNVQKFMTGTCRHLNQSTSYASRWEALVLIIGKSATTRSSINCFMLCLPLFACDRENGACNQSKTLSYQERWQGDMENMTSQKTQCMWPLHK